MIQFSITWNVPYRFSRARCVSLPFAIHSLSKFFATSTPCSVKLLDLGFVGVELIWLNPHLLLKFWSLPAMKHSLSPNSVEFPWNSVACEPSLESYGDFVQWGIAQFTVADETWTTISMFAVPLRMTMRQPSSRQPLFPMGALGSPLAWGVRWVVSFL